MNLPPHEENASAEKQSGNADRFKIDDRSLQYRFTNFLALVWSYFVFNLKSQWEYRGAFLSQMLAMFTNNIVWVVFWCLFFTRFPVVNGWDIKDIITLWTIASAGFGLAHTVCGNALALPWLIARGQLDVWMLYPRALLSHMLLGKMSATACGDFLFGFVVYILFVKPDFEHLLLYMALTVATAFTFIGFSVLSGSLTFFVGNGEALAEQWRFSMVTFSTYPATLFEGVVKFILYTLIPAGFVSYLPIVALKEMSLYYALLTLAGAFAVMIVGIAVFHIGLRRYESGNLLEMRG